MKSMLRTCDVLLSTTCRVVVSASEIFMAGGWVLAVHFAARYSVRDEDRARGEEGVR